MPKSKRVEQVAAEIQTILGELVRSSIKDPRMGFATVMNVNLSPDLYYAHVNISVMGDEEQQQATIQTLERAKGFLRHELGQQLNLRQIPELRFHLDTTLETRAHMDTLFNTIEQERLQNPPQFDDDEE